MKLSLPLPMMDGKEIVSCRQQRIKADGKVQITFHPQDGNIICR